MGIFLLMATLAQQYMAMFVKIYGHRTSGRFKRAGVEVCDFDKTWSACCFQDSATFY